MEEPVKRARGRPPKPDAVRKRKNQTFRLRTDLNERLEAAAAANQRSISEEVEDRVSRSFQRDDLAGDPTIRALADAVIVTVQLAQANMGHPWGANDFTARVTFDRIKLMLSYLMGVPITDENLSDIDKVIAESAALCALAQEKNYIDKPDGLAGHIYSSGLQRSASGSARDPMHAGDINHIRSAFEYLRKRDGFKGSKEQE